MTETPSIVKSGSSMPYVWALVILVLIGALFIVGLLALRPQADLLVVITAVVGAAGLIFGNVATLLKTLETHLVVNSMSTEKEAAATARAHAEGMLEGASNEQARIAKQVLNAAAVAGSGTAPPVPVEVVAPHPIPVEEVKKT